MAYQWKTNKDTPVAVDGSVGPQTTKALQYGLGITDDGQWGAQTTRCLQELYGATPYDGVLGPVTIRGLQSWIGVTVDGVLGPLTVTALQNALNKGTMGSRAAAGSGDTKLGDTGGTVTSTGGGLSAISTSSVQYVRGQATPNHVSAVEAACAAAGLTYSSGWQNGYETLCSRESSWNPNSVNDYDSNAVGAIVADGYPYQCSRGLAQCIPQTFAAYHAAGTSNNIYDPVANIAASMLYVVHVYGVARDGSNLAANVQQADSSRSPKGY